MVGDLWYAYTLGGGLPWMQAVFYGIGAAVIGIIAISSYKLCRKSLGKDWMFWSIAIILAVSTAIAEREILWLILGGGLIVWLFRAPPKFFSARSLLLTPFFLQVASSLTANEKLSQLGWFFLKAGAFVFGVG
jgi:chromate transporter